MQRSEVAPGVHRFSDGIVNWYLLEEDGRIVAIDAGWPSHYKELRRAVDDLDGELTDVLLTHSHLDHTGWAESARRDLGATVRLHAEDVAFARSPVPLAPSERSPLVYALKYNATRMLFLKATLSRGPLGQRISQYRTFDGDETLDDVPGRPLVIFCPGHSRGHCAFHFAGRDLLFAGDALVTRDPYTGHVGPRIVSAAATYDTRLNLDTLERLVGSGARTVLSGHGEPWTQGVQLAVERARAAGVS